MEDHKASEAATLRRLFDASGFKKAEFAAAHRVPGGPSMVSQHLSGTRPISRAAAIAYAKGFGVSLGEISPRLAGDFMKSAAVMPPAFTAQHDRYARAAQIRPTADAGESGKPCDERTEMLRDISDWLPLLPPRDLIQIYSAVRIALESARRPKTARDARQQPSGEDIPGLELPR